MFICDFPVLLSPILIPTNLGPNAPFITSKAKAKAHKSKQKSTKAQANGTLV